MIICFMNDIRQELVTLAHNMVQNHELENIEDIWFIRLNELRTHFQQATFATETDCQRTTNGISAFCASHASTGNHQRW